MRGLLYKEFCLGRKNLLAVFGTELIFSITIAFPTIMDKGKDMSAVFNILGFAGVVLMFLIMMMFVPSIFDNDEHKKWAYFICSSPEGCRGQVASKYLFAVILYMIAFVWVYIISSVQTVLTDAPNFSLIGLYMIWILIIMHSIEFPFITRFGTKLGNSVRTVMFMMLVNILLIIFGFADIEAVRSPEAFFNFVEKLLGKSGMSNLTSIFLAVLPFAAIICYLISYRISCALYIKGAESYDK